MRALHCSNASAVLWRCSMWAYVCGIEWSRRVGGHIRRSKMLLWGFLARQFRRWQVYNRTVAELSSLDDRSLADSNVSRSEIRAVARHASVAA